MKQIFKLITILFLALMYSGCAFMHYDNAASEVILHPEKLKDVKTVAVLPVAEPSQYRFDPSMSGAVSSLLGPLASLATAENKDTSFLSDLNFTSIATSSLLKALKKNGFEASVLDVSRPIKSKLLEDYSVLPETSADAILDVGPYVVGFWSVIKDGWPEGDAITPQAFLEFRLISNIDKSVIANANVYVASDDISKNKYLKGPAWTSPSDLIFKNAEEIKNDPNLAKKRLTYTIEAATNLIAEYLSKNMKGNAVNNQ